MKIVCASFSILFIFSHITQSMEAGLEQERLQQEAELNQKVNEEEVRQQTKRNRAY